MYECGKVERLVNAAVRNRHRERRGASVRGGQMYDALIATAALKAGASAILTWNRHNFEPFAGDIQIESPPESP